MSFDSCNAATFDKKPKLIVYRFEVLPTHDFCNCRYEQNLSLLVQEQNYSDRVWISKNQDTYARKYIKTVWEEINNEKKIFTALLVLCMLLMLSPLTVIAECYCPWINSISVITQVPPGRSEAVCLECGAEGRLVE